MSQVFLPCIAGTLTFGPGRDPYWNNVVLLLHCEGTNGSTTIVDSSSAPKTVTATGSTISTARQKFGSASILGGTSKYFTISLGTAGSMTGDFTWESWIYGGNNGVVFYSTGSGGHLYNNFFQGYGGTNLGITTLLTAAWHHVAISRTGSSLRGFTDGVLIDTKTYAPTIDLQTLVCGTYVPNANLFWMDNYDDMRITKGVGRYTATFTPPTRKFPDS